MTIFDPIYGPCDLAPRLAELALAPEVRRLTQIRLLNTSSPTLATLGELRRYSHTLGVLRLALINGQPGYSPEERAAFAASVLIHDIGTPPFGHLMEYHLREQLSWSHEEVVARMLWGLHTDENLSHQIFAGMTLEVRRILKRRRISLDIVRKILTKDHPLSRLLFGSIDLDNLDNVARMAWAVGITCVDSTLALAAALSVSRDGRLLLPESCRPAVERWAGTRRSVYEILLFDPATVASQAVLSKAIGIAMTAGDIGGADWCMYDETLLEKLRQSPGTRKLVTSFLGRLPGPIYALNLRGTLASYGLGNRAAAVGAALSSLGAHRSGDCIAYAFVDKGATAKALEFADPASGRTWCFGETSESVVFSVFSYGRPERKEATAAASRLLRTLGARPDDVIRVQIGRDRPAYSSGNDKQLTLQAL
ncbi:MAG: HD domain-containing protein [Terriglobales bacterium]